LAAKDNFRLLAKEILIRLIALVIAGLWAYFKFISGRVFRPRLEPNVSGKAVKKGEFIYAYVEAKLKNVDLSKVDIKQEGTAVSINCAPVGWPREVMNPEWDREGTFPIFQAHDWIEPGELIGDDQLIVLPGAEWTSVRIDLRISSGKMAWSSKGLLEIEEPETKEKEQTMEQMREKRRNKKG
jgi:hypothetical protein